MNLYHCMIELRSGAKALPFASAADQWLSGLRDKGVIAEWRLFRRKFGLGSSTHTDFILEIEVEDMGQLDEAFRVLSASDDDDTQQYELLHQMIESVDIGLYRPYPDASQRETVALI
jgi:hypothetical protein